MYSIRWILPQCCACNNSVGQSTNFIFQLGFFSLYMNDFEERNRKVKIQILYLINNIDLVNVGVYSHLFAMTHVLTTLWSFHFNFVYCSFLGFFWQNRENKKNLHIDNYIMPRCFHTLAILSYFFSIQPIKKVTNISVLKATYISWNQLQNTTGKTQYKSM